MYHMMLHMGAQRAAERQGHAFRWRTVTKVPMTAEGFANGRTAQKSMAASYSPRMWVPMAWARRFASFFSTTRMEIPKASS
jgi:hypothetical protein